jgi:outer membrane protein OmpA-like peptidoglycan-associated protein
MCVTNDCNGGPEPPLQSAVQEDKKKMRRLMIVLLILAATTLSNACIASRKFVRNEVKTSSDALAARLDTRIDTNEGNIKETQDAVAAADRRITTVDERLTRVNTETGQRLDGLRGDVATADQKAVDARAAADRVNGSLGTLDQKFQNRNNFSVGGEKTIMFKFDSALLDDAQHAALDEVAQMLMQNRDALVVLEGRTDSLGDQDYNVRLGERRVEAVRRYLAVEKGVPVYRIHNISFGAAQPIAPNDSREGREKNRAVSITLLVPLAQAARDN